MTKDRIEEQIATLEASAKFLRSLALEYPNRLSDEEAAHIPVATTAIDSQIVLLQRRLVEIEG